MKFMSRQVLLYSLCIVTTLTYGSSKRSYSRNKSSDEHAINDLSSILTSDYNIELLAQPSNEWNPSPGAPSVVWYSSASSASGQYLYGGVNYGALYYSITYGAVWTESSGIPTDGYWFGVACSTDGSYVVAVALDTGIYVSTNNGVDYSVTSAPAYQWYAVASSSDFSLLAAVAQNELIYLSNDYGATWSAVASSAALSWTGISMAYSGEYMVAVSSGEGIYVSSNYGASFSAVADSVGSLPWSSVAMSSSGEYATATQCSGNMYYSTDFGLAWSPSTVLPGGAARCFPDVSMSSTGEYQIAVSDGYIYMSANYGADFAVTENAPTADWSSVSSSSSGQYIVATQSTGSVYLGTIVIPDTTSSPSSLPTIGTSDTYSWTKPTNGVTSTLSWFAITSSTTGQYLAAGCYNSGNIFLSQNNGASWALSTAPEANWVTIASSSNGEVIVAAAVPGYIYVSTNFGLTFSNSGSSSLGSLDWMAVAVDATGTVMLGAAYDGGVYLSTNGGSSWTLTTLPTDYWLGVAIAAENTNIMVAASEESYIYVSSNGGNTWVIATPTVQANWKTISVSDDGMYMMACTIDTGLFYSQDYGTTWTVSTAPVTSEWYAVTSSSSGTIVVAAADGGYIYVSNDYGVTFEIITELGGQAWTSLASDASGSQIAATINGGGVYIGVDNSVPSAIPTFYPTMYSAATELPTTDVNPTIAPSTAPTIAPTEDLSKTLFPSIAPTTPPTELPVETVVPSTAPTTAPTLVPGETVVPSTAPTTAPSLVSGETFSPSVAPTTAPSLVPGETVAPSTAPTTAPTLVPGETVAPSTAPTTAPSLVPGETVAPSTAPTTAPTLVPGETVAPSSAPTTAPTLVPGETVAPSTAPTTAPTLVPGETVVPSTAPTTVPTLVPGETVAPSTAPITAPSLVPGETVVPSTAPTTAPTLVPGETVAPSTASTTAPSLVPGETFNPSVAPTIAPSTFPSISPSMTPVSTSKPTTTAPTAFPINPSRFPTFIPSRAPSVQTSPIVTFNSNVTLDGVTSSVLDVECQNAIVATTALSMGVSMSDVMYLGCAHVTQETGRLRRRLQNNNTVQYDLVAMTRTSLSVASSGYTNSSDLYTTCVKLYDVAVVSGAYTETLRQQSIYYSAVATLNATATFAQVSIPFVANLPTFAPSASPTISTAPGVIENIGTIVPGVVLFALMLVILYLRYPMRDMLNETNSAIGEVSDAILKCVIIILSLNVIADYSSDTKSVSFILLVFSKVVLLMLWCVFIWAFFVPYKDNHNKNKVQLALLLHKEPWKVRISFTAYGLLMTMSVFDLTVLRLMPWLRTKVTERFMGYPNKFMIRCCLYGTFLAQMIQSLAVIIRVSFESGNMGSGSESEKNKEKAYLLLAFTVFNVLRAYVSMLFIVRVAESEKLKLAVVNESDVAALANFVVQNPDKQVDSNDTSKRKLFTPSRISVMLHNASASNSVQGSEVQNPISLACDSRDFSVDELKNNDARDRNASFLMSDDGSMTEQREWDGVPRFVGGKALGSEVSALSDEVDERGIRFSTNTKFADQTLDILRMQLKKEGKVPVEFIPLPDLKAEIAIIFSKANNGVPYDEQRLDYLLMCMDFNPEYKLEKEGETRRWRNEIGPFAADSLEMMRGFVPPYIFHASIASLTTDDGMSPDLAKRIMTKKCLWLVRISTADIDRMHIAELMGRFNPEAQGLDIVEIAAIFASVPEKFSNDPDGKKERWRASLEQNLKNLVIEKSNRTIMKSKLRNAVYTNQEPVFAHRETLHQMHVTSGEDAFKPRSSFRNLNSVPISAYNSSGGVMGNAINAAPVGSGEMRDSELDTFAPLPRASLTNLNLNDNKGGAGGVYGNALPPRVSVTNRATRTGSLRGSVIGETLNKIFSSNMSSNGSVNSAAATTRSVNDQL